VKSPLPIEKTVANIARVFQQVDQAKRSLGKLAEQGLAVDAEMIVPWAIAHRVCDRYTVLRTATRDRTTDAVA
jgi:hypothetical protein